MARHVLHRPCSHRTIPPKLRNPETPKLRNRTFSCTRGEAGYPEGRCQTFRGWGRGWPTARARPLAGTEARAAPRLWAGDASRRLRCRFFSSPELFPRRLLVVMPLAKALVVGRVYKQRPVPAVRPDVIHYRGPRPVPGITRRICPRTLSAPRLSQQLRRAQGIRPDRQRVPRVVPCTGAALMPGLVPRTPAVPRQLRTPCVPAGPERLLRHGLSPPRYRRKQKAGTNDHARFALITGSGFQSSGLVRYPR